MAQTRATSAALFSVTFIRLQRKVDVVRATAIVAIRSKTAEQAIPKLTTTEGLTLTTVTPIATVSVPYLSEATVTGAVKVPKNPVTSPIAKPTKPPVTKPTGVSSTSPFLAQTPKEKGFPITSRGPLSPSC